jgi:hypothetical protein
LGPSASYRAFIAHFFPVLPPAQYEPFVTWRMRITGSAEFERFAKASALTYQMIYRGPVIDLYPTLKPPVLLGSLLRLRRGHLALLGQRDEAFRHASGGFREALKLRFSRLQRDVVGSSKTDPQHVHDHYKQAGVIISKGG